MEAQEQKAEQGNIIETPLGFLDITEALSRREIDNFYKYDVIRGIFVDIVKTESYNKGEYAEKQISIGNFYVRKYGIRGRVFSMDEIIKEKRRYDIIIQNWRRENKFPPINIDSNIYHDFYPGEKIKVKISGKGREAGDPSFKLFNHITGFVKRYHQSINKKIDIGDNVLIEIIDCFERNEKYHIEVKALEILENVE